MVNKELLISVAFAALALASDSDEVEQKKRGVGKGSNVNTIPTGAQKPDYTYSIYPQSSSNSSPNPTYQSQPPNSFYPSQNSHQYYSSNSAQSDANLYPPQPQINLLPPPNSSPYVPLNFIPNPGYQAKYQLVPSKTPNGNIQLALVQPSYQSSPIVSYPHLFAQASNQISTQHNSLTAQNQYNIAPNYQPLSFGSPYVSQPSTMLLLSPANPSLYSNLLYPNPVQSFYYPSSPQAKTYSLSYNDSPVREYEKLPGPVSQIVPKEDNDISNGNNEYTSPPDNVGYKNVYTPSHSSSYSKL